MFWGCCASKWSWAEQTKTTMGNISFEHLQDEKKVTGISIRKLGKQTGIYIYSMLVQKFYFLNSNIFFPIPWHSSCNILPLFLPILFLFYPFNFNFSSCFFFCLFLDYFPRFYLPVFIFISPITLTDIPPMTKCRDFFAKKRGETLA